jgi:hypothetical protein
MTGIFVGSIELVFADLVFADLVFTKSALLSAFQSKANNSPNVQQNEGTPSAQSESVNCSPTILKLPEGGYMALTPEQIDLIILSGNVLASPGNENSTLVIFEKNLTVKYS